MRSITFLAIALVVVSWTTDILAEEVYESEIVASRGVSTETVATEPVSAVTPCANNYCIGLNSYQCQEALHHACKNKKKAGLVVCGTGKNIFGEPYYISMTCPTSPASAITVPLWEGMSN